ncbi:hypothetical protein K5X82_01815 [Halosquirtibacter xylanolyticus]|uniref:hypothetical protein n=1 Tax=Halosquirtibacter xylanolyticus TaxID=3374599 RepID=UPI00374A533F|nr:hypothetical protein K5X82_01815 [Prolixibacteraceae bacterium]
MKYSLLLLLLITLISCDPTSESIQIRRENIEPPLRVTCKSSQENSITFDRHLRYKVENTSSTPRIMAGKAQFVYYSDSRRTKEIELKPEKEDSLHYYTTTLSKIKAKDSQYFQARFREWIEFDLSEGIMAEEKPDNIKVDEHGDTIKTYLYSSYEDLPFILRTCVANSYANSHLNIIFLDEELPFYIKKEENNLTIITAPATIVDRSYIDPAQLMRPTF